jgi:hypothetical protein
MAGIEKTPSGQMPIAPIPLPRPNALRTETPAQPSSQDSIQNRIDDAHAAVAAQPVDSALQAALLKKGEALTSVNLFDEKPASASLGEIRQSLSNELQRLGNVRHYKADLNADKIKDLLQTLDSNLPDSKKIAQLHAQLKEIEKSHKTDSFGDILGGLFGNAPADPTATPSLESVKTLTDNYLQALHSDFFTKPRPWQ